MQISNLPKLLPVPFANSGSKQDIPVASQIGVSGGRASYTDGFPPLTRTPIAAGGIPPFGTDFNGVLNDITTAIRWSQAGGGYGYDSTFSSAVSGYPIGARLLNSTGDGYWLNTVDNNTNNPEVSSSTPLTGWVPDENHGITSITGLGGSSVTLSTLQASRPRINLAGSLTANINLVLPAWQRKWVIENNCTGAFSVTVKTSAGTGVPVYAGMTASLYGNGTNIYLDNNTQNVSMQVTGIIGHARNITMAVTSSSTTATITADEVIVGNGLGGSQFRIGGFNKTINLASTGAGGMDTGTVPVNGFVGIYVIYNPANNTSALLAVNATSSVVPEIYGGSNMPAGYTASALVSVWPVVSGQFNTGIMVDREISYPPGTVLTTSTTTSTFIPFSIAGAVPLNAKFVKGTMQAGSTSSSALIFQASSDANGTAVSSCVINSPGAGNVGNSLPLLPIKNQTLYYKATSTAGTPTYIIGATGYRF